MEFIKPGTKLDFMGKRKFFFALSGSLLLASIVSLSVLSLNRGIDFKGGTKLIVSFKEGAQVERDAIKVAIDDMVSQELGTSGTQVEVQDFDLGSETVEGQEPTIKYLIYSELTTLLTDEKRAAVVRALQERFGKDLIVDMPEEAGDVFYLTFPDDGLVPQRTLAITETFVAEPLKFTKVHVVSEKERELDVEYIKEVNLIRQEGAGAETPEALTREAFEERKQRLLAEMKDIRFTVNLEEINARVTALLGQRFPNAFLAVEESTSVSAAVGADLFADGLLAILYAMLGILLYIALRFNFTYSPGAVAALIHDVIVTVGVFSVAQIKFTLPIIAALLTIIGYSLNDTIVVFDRIRENSEKYRAKALDAVINTSVNETLSRTVLTSLTTLIVVGSVLVLGGGLIRDFALALCIGVVIGTYSSIGVASPVVYYLDRFFQRRKAKARAK